VKPPLLVQSSVAAILAPFDDTGAQVPNVTTLPGVLGGVNADLALIIKPLCPVFSVEIVLCVLVGVNAD
jgi:hypothetical protein